MSNGPSPHPGTPVQSQLGLLSDDELDLADYLRDEPEDEIVAAAPQGLAALTLGAIGIVYGDIGTSPIYAFREAIHHVGHDGLHRAEILGLLSLLIWALILIVTVKYVLFLLRADNRGEGGVLSLYTLVRLAIGRRSVPVLILALIGAALFAGDAIITPAISVLSAVEGARLIVPQLADWVVPITLGILIALFVAQRKGTSAIAGAFGPITALWFAVLGGMGLWHLIADPAILASFNPVWGIRFIANHWDIAFIVMGSVFLAVTGAEALYADLGHFGRRPIMLAWFALVFPALVLNYLGQGALVLADPEADADPFFRMVGGAGLPFLVALATAATVIASQATISGAFSMARSALQLGLLPRMTIRHTSYAQSGHIYIATINWLMLAGVVLLVLNFGSSAALASAYGISVTGTMVVTTVLAILFAWMTGKAPLWLATLIALPILLLELVFLSANLTKIADGGYVPALLAAVVGLLMWAWWRGTQAMLTRLHRQAVPVEGFVRSMAHSSAHVVPGTAFFLSPDAQAVPSALLHNLKHNRVLHDRNVFVTVETLRIPVAPPEERATWEQLDTRFSRLILRFGYMETPNISRAMVHARRAGLKFDVMQSSFFLGRRRPVVVGPIGVERLLDNLYAALSRFSADPSDFYHLPRDRVVELGERVAV